MTEILFYFESKRGILLERRNKNIDKHRGLSMQRINEDLRTGQLKKMYLLYGEEAYLRKQYRDRLKEAIIGDDTMNYYYH